MERNGGGAAEQQHDDWMRLAIQLASENVSAGGGPFGAVIVRDGRLLASGSNEVVTGNDPTAHAEIVALRRACAVAGTYTLEGCVLYSSCEPCPMCLGAILWARCGALYFGNTSADAAAAGFADAAYYSEVCKPMGQRSLPAANLLRQEAGASFRAWAASGNRIVY